MGIKRSIRVGDLIRREVSFILEKELRDPRLGFVTVTGTDVTPDLRSARIYVSVLGDDDKVKENLKALKGAEKYVRYLIAERIRLKYVPEISFHIDQSQIYGERIDRILKEVKQDDS
jgi:ribosome-binding factor A